MDIPKVHLNKPIGFAEACNNERNLLGLSLIQLEIN